MIRCSGDPARVFVCAASNLHGRRGQLILQKNNKVAAPSAEESGTRLKRPAY
jgi:hypothetical protein